jgi:hypothetical protein
VKRNISELVLLQKMTENGEKESELAKPFIPSENEVNVTLLFTSRFYHLPQVA